MSGDPPPPPRELRPISALLLVGIRIIGFLLILSLGQSFSDSEDEISRVLISTGQLAAALIALYVGLVRHAPNEPTAVALRLTRPDAHAWRILGLGVAYGVLVAAPLTALLDAIISAGDLDDAGVKLTDGGPGAGWIIPIAGVAMIVVEEALFRGLIQPRLVRLTGVARGLALSVVLYAAASLNPLAAPMAIGPAIFAHASGSSWPAAASVLAMAIAAPLLVGLDMPWWSTALATVGAAGAAWVTWRVRRPR